jgi:hypothetical protein
MSSAMARRSMLSSDKLSLARSIWLMNVLSRFALRPSCSCEMCLSTRILRTLKAKTSRSVWSGAVGSAAFKGAGTGRSSRLDGHESTAFASRNQRCYCLVMQKHLFDRCRTCAGRGTCPMERHA